MKSTIRARAFPRRAIVTQALPCLGGLWLVWWMAQHAGEAGLAGLLPGLGAIAPVQWAVALGFTAISYLAIGRYDRALHGWLDTGVDPAAAERGGRAAIAVSQMTGMGLITGTLLRWYILPQLSLPRAAAVTAAVGASFLAGFAVVAAAVGLASGILPAPLALAAWSVLGALALLALAIVALPRHPLARALPPLPRLGVVIGLVAVDVLAAGIAFGALIGSFDPGVIAASVLALGAGLVAATPAGVGGFEAALVTLAPGWETGPLITAALAFHIVYFAVPGVLSAGVILARPGLLRRAAGGAEAPRVADGRAPALLRQLEEANRAEAALVAQGGNAALTDASGRLLACLRRARSTLVAFAAPCGTMPFAVLERRAGQEGRVALAYKAAPRCAASARRAGWAVRRCGAEAWLRPQDFSPEGAARRQLRRKLRQADRARLVVERLAVPLPWAVLEEVDAAWRDARGAARGACMGRLCPTATARQVIFAARVEGRMLAYVSLHATPREWTLDLMRARPDAPDGTMHALVAAAIAAAAEAGVPRLSLAAVPEQRLPGPLARLFDRTTCAAGLRQFKASFAPNWTPLYAAAPSGPALALGLVDLAREIVAPS